MTVIVAANTKSGFYNAACGEVLVSSIVPRFPYCSYETPVELTGNAPIHTPTLNGVDQFLLLDKNWAIVVIQKLGEVYAEIDTLSSGALQTAVDTWLNGILTSSNPSRGTMWTTRDTYIAEARKTVEAPLAATTYYGITSADDANYSVSQNPSQADYIHVSVGGSTNGSSDQLALDAYHALENPAGVFEIDYRLYCYLNFPTSMVDGKTYTITLTSGEACTFTFDKTATVSRAIKVNQVGYLPAAAVTKAYMGCYLYQFGELDLSHATTFDVIDTTTLSVEYSGSVTLKEAAPLINPGTFTTLTQTGGLASGTTTYPHQLNTTHTIDLVADGTDWDGTFTVTRVNDTQITFAIDSGASSPATNAVITNSAGNSQWSSDPMYGEDVYEMDFSAMTATGEFYISVPGVGRSWPFKHISTTYNATLYSAMRGLYRQRAGMEIPTAYSDWPRRKCKMGPFYYENEVFVPPQHTKSTLPVGTLGESFNRFDIAGGSTDYNITTAEFAGGWHDAADWDCIHTHLTTVFDLLYAYQFYTSTFSDDQFNIPESGDGVPDILSEARHGLEVWRMSQDANGGISSQLETWTHPPVTSVTQGSSNPPTALKCDYGFGTRTRWASLVFAAAAAQYARLVTPFDATDATLYQTAAENAFTFGTTAGNSLGVDFPISANLDRGNGAAYTLEYTELDADLQPYQMHAKLQLYLLTTTATYITDAPSVATLEAASQPPYAWTWGRQDWSQWIFYSIIEASDAGYTGLDTLAGEWRTWFNADADVQIDNQADSPYPMSWPRTDPQSTAWGSGYMPNRNRALAIAYENTGTAKYYDAAALNADFAFGCNPQGMSWTTGVGYVYPITINHEISESDGILDPPPGVTIYGLTGSPIYFTFRTDVWDAHDDAEAVTSITQTGGTATVTTTAAHGLSNGDPITILGAVETGYNVQGVVANVASTTFEYTVDSGTAASATGTLKWNHNMVTDPAQRIVPKWRRFMVHPRKNVAQCEFTHHETMSPTIFTAAFLATGVSAEEKVRAPENLHGRWYLP